MKKCWAGKEEKHICMQAKDKLFEASLITQSQIQLRYNTGKNPIFPSRCFPSLWLWRRLAPQPHSSPGLFSGASPPSSICLGLSTCHHTKEAPSWRNKCSLWLHHISLYHVLLSVVSGFSNVSSEVCMLLKILAKLTKYQGRQSAE